MEASWVPKLSPILSAKCPANMSHWGCLPTEYWFKRGGGFGPTGAVQGPSGPAYKLGASCPSAGFASETSSEMVARLWVHVSIQIILLTIRMIWLRLGCFQPKSSYVIWPIILAYQQVGSVRTLKKPKHACIPRHSGPPNPSPAIAGCSGRVGCGIQKPILRHPTLPTVANS